MLQLGAHSVMCPHPLLLLLLVLFAAVTSSFCCCCRYVDRPGELREARPPKTSHLPLAAQAALKQHYQQQQQQQQ